MLTARIVGLLRGFSNSSTKISPLSLKKYVSNQQSCLLGQSIPLMTASNGGLVSDIYLHCLVYGQQSEVQCESRPNKLLPNVFCPTLQATCLRVNQLTVGSLGPLPQTGFCELLLLILPMVATFPYSHSTIADISGNCASCCLGHSEGRIWDVLAGQLTSKIFSVHVVHIALHNFCHCVQDTFGLLLMFACILDIWLCQ